MPLQTCREACIIKDTQCSDNRQLYVCNWLIRITCVPAGTAPLHLLRLAGDGLLQPLRLAGAAAMTHARQKLLLQFSQCHTAVALAKRTQTE